MDKSKRFASGSLVGIKTDLTTNFSIIKRIIAGIDKNELVKLNIWKKNVLFKIYSLYNLLINYSNLEFIDN